MNVLIDGDRREVGRRKTASPELDARLGDPGWVDNWTLGRGLRFELIEQATKRVFLCQAEISADELSRFEAPEGFAHVLAGSVQADLAFFARSPGADADGQLDTVELGGRRFSFVASPLAVASLDSGAMEMTIDKYHAMLYRAGRTIDMLDLGDGTVATPAWGSLDPDAVLTDTTLESGWTLRRVELADDLIVVIPNPARVLVLDTSFGFHGPVDADIVERVAA